MSRLSGAFDALVIAPEPPYPLIGGGPNRTASIIEYIATQGGRVHVITFLEPGDPDPRPLFPPTVHADIITLRPHGRTRRARFSRNARRAARGVPPLVDRFSGYRDELRQLLASGYRLGVVEHFWCAPYVDVLRPYCRRLVLDLHNIDSLLLDRCATVEPFPSSWLHRRFAKCCKALEAELLPAFDSILVPSEEDAARLQRPAVVYPNAIPWRAQPRPEKRFDLVFSGNLEYAPNLDALRWLRREVWPALRRSCPSLTLSIVGRNHQRAARELPMEGATFSGPVDDALGAIALARVAVVPIRAGSGTRVKILEAWAAGLPVVSTAMGAEGFGATDGIHLAETADDFRAAVLALLREGWEEQGRRGRTLYERSYNWPVVWRILEEEGF